MKYNILIQSEAFVELRIAFDWYEDQRVSLGFELIMEIESGLDKLKSAPLNYSAINKRFRRLKIKRFPFFIVYEVEDMTVIINSIQHCSKNPRFR